MTYMLHICEYIISILYLFRDSGSVGTLILIGFTPIKLFYIRKMEGQCGSLPPSVETMKAEGHKAIVATAAASNLGQMLDRICRKDGIALVNIVRSASHAPARERRDPCARRQRRRL